MPLKYSVQLGWANDLWRIQTIFGGTAPDPTQRRRFLSLLKVRLKLNKALGEVSVIIRPSATGRHLPYYLPPDTSERDPYPS